MTWKRVIGLRGRFVPRDDGKGGDDLEEDAGT